MQKKTKKKNNPQRLLLFKGFWQLVYEPRQVKKPAEHAQQGFNIVSNNKPGHHGQNNSQSTASNGQLIAVFL